MTTPYRHLLWDLGGTLVDTYPALDRAFAAVLAAHGHAVEEVEVSRLTRVSTGHAVETLARRFAVDEAEFEAANDRLKEHWRTHPAPVMAGAHALMADVRAAGGLNLVATHRDRTSAMSLVDGLGLVVDDLVSTSDGFPRKPDPAMIHEILHRHGIAPDDCLAVGDRPIDAEAAVAASVDTALLFCPCAPPATVPHHPIEALDDLRPLLDLEPHP